MAGLVLFYGCYDLSFSLPSHYTINGHPRDQVDGDDQDDLNVEDEDDGDGDDGDDDDDDGFYTSPPLIIPAPVMYAFRKSYLPPTLCDDTEALRDPLISPLYEDLPRLLHRANNNNKRNEKTLRLRLPPALFLCGALDPLLDDTMLMGIKWEQASAAAAASSSSSHGITKGGEDAAATNDARSTSVVRLWAGAPHGFDLMEGVGAAEEGRKVADDFIKGLMMVS